MKQIRLLLLSLLLTQIGYGQDCSIQKLLSDDVSICIGESTTITLFSTENLVSYQLRDALNNNIGSPILGDGSDITFDVSPGSTTTYNVLSFTTVPFCATDITDTVTISVNNQPSISLSSANDIQAVCINDPINDISYTINDATGASVSGLPTGVVGNYVAGVYTISGTPSVAGTFNYTVTTTGGCAPAVSLGGTITVTPSMALVLTTANNTQTVCINTAIANISYNVGNATGASVSGLPTGVVGNYSAGIYTISGTPSVAGTFNYTVTTTGGCAPAVSLGGSIAVTPSMTLALTTGNNTQTVCINTSIANISYNVGNATGASISGLPTGVVGNYSAGVYTISGTPSVAGTFNYTVTTTGGCVPAVSLGGSITVTPSMTLALTTGNNTQTVCINTAIANIRYNVGNATGASVSGLPTGVVGNYSAGIYTISGTPSVAGTFNYTVTTTGGCAPAVSLGGSISVTPSMTLALATGNNTQTVCINTAIANIRYNVGNATGASVIGLPAGVVGNFSAGVYTISGTSSVSGTFNYTVTTIGGCAPAVSLGGSITIQPLAVGGTVSDTSGVNPVTVCYSSPSGTLNLTGQAGIVTSWEKSTDGGITWSNIVGTAGLTSYIYAGLTITSIFRAIIQNGVLCPVVRSSSVLVNVIPNVKPDPVVATPPTICAGDSSILSSLSGYATSQNLATGGTFNNSNPPGWLVDSCPNCLNAGASNTNPGPFQLSATNGGTYSGITYTATGKFVIANGPFDSILETPVFSTLGLGTATLQFNHAFNLRAGAWVRVELSTNGGATYTTILSQYNGVSTRTPYTNFPLQTINLNSYIGQPNLRIRFNYHGVGTSSWAVDNIIIPDVPVNITTQWVDTVGNVISTGANYTVSPLVTTTYGVRSTFVINGSTTCVSSGTAGTTYVTVTVNQRPTAIIGPSQTVCNNTAATFSVALTGVGPWNITYNDGTTSTTVSTNTNPYIFNTPNLTTNKTYRITALSDSRCTAIAADFTAVANVSVLNGTPGMWTGLVGTDWFDCMNWAGGGVNPPSITTDVVIPSGRPNMPNIDALTSKAIPYSGIANARDITISGSSSLTMSNSSTLNIGSDWRNNGVFNSGNGTVAFRGATLNQVQQINNGIKSNEDFYNLTLNNSGGAKGINLSDNFQLTVGNNLTLQSGDLRLTGEAQLLQLGSVANPLVGTGRLFRDQQGKKSSYHYTYWSSPVSNDNINYTLSANMKDGTDVTTDPFGVTNITFGDGSAFADGVATNPIKISNRWLYKYAAIGSSYSNWERIGNTGIVKAGEGFLMKGCDGTVDPSALQNLVFVGKPNNGNIDINLGATQTYLVGNPYPSALDADKFIRDNIKDGGNAASNKFSGVLYFWDHFGGFSHYLSAYVGGYATYTLMGGVVAVSNDPSTANTGASGTKVPKRYIPVAQGFFIGTDIDASLTTNNPNLTSPITGGTINFRNSQRAFITEASGNSVMMRTASNSSDEVLNESDLRQKIRLQFISPSGVNRQLLVGTDENASSNYDLGFDAPMIDVQTDDMFWDLSGNKFIIQGISNFNLEQKIPLGIKTESQGEVLIKIATLENIDSTKEIYLHDELTGISHDLREGEFKTVLDKGDYVNRFSIRFDKQTLGTDDNVITNGITIYYTKNDNLINVVNNTNANLKEIQLFNILGQRVFKSSLDNLFKTNIKVPLKKLGDGTYIVKLISDNGNPTKKVIIN
ncbi:MAG: T9SS type A sorting domain-containing protein [Bacteroidota bacterium]